MFFFLFFYNSTEFGSPDLTEVQKSFPDRMLSVVCRRLHRINLSFFLKSFFVFSFFFFFVVKVNLLFPPRDLCIGQFQTNFAQSIVKLRGSNFDQLKGNR